MRNLVRQCREHGSRPGRKRVLRTRRWLNRPVTAAVVVIAAVCALAVPGLASASALRVGTSWRRATQISQPSNASAHPDAGLGTVACWTARACEAGGSYVAANADGYPMVDSRSARGWAKAIRLRLPSNAEASPQGTIDSIACTGAGSCIAAGSYSYAGAKTAQTGAFLAAQRKGLWARAAAPKLPANAAASPFSEVAAVACTGPGSCVAAGNYEVTGGSLELMVATQSRGRWARARELLPPRNAHLTPASAYFLGLACPKAGHCVAVGFYADSAGHDQPLVARESNGHWARAAGVVLPVGSASTPFGEFRGVACSKAGYCVAVGTYAAGPAGDDEAMAATESAGVWRRAVRIRLAPLGVSAQAGLDKVACDRAGACVAVGGYFTPTYSVAASATQSHGRWEPPAYVTLPPGAGLGSSEHAVLVGVACVRTCNAVGAYADRSDHFHPMAAAGSAP
jgi:hypothetical protein